MTSEEALEQFERFHWRIVANESLVMRDGKLHQAIKVAVICLRRDVQTTKENMKDEQMAPDRP